MRYFFRASTLAVVALCATAALAQPKPALVRDIDQPARAKYQQTIVRTAAECGDSAQCSFVFDAVPAGKRLVATWVNVHYALASDTSASEVHFKPVNGNQPFVYLSPSPDPFAGNRRNIQAAVTLYLEAGDVPIVVINGPMQAVNDAYATLVGYFVSLP